jgi:hypothetical protein
MSYRPLHLNPVAAQMLQSDDPRAVRQWYLRSIIEQEPALRTQYGERCACLSRMSSSGMKASSWCQRRLARLADDAEEAWGLLPELGRCRAVVRERPAPLGSG